MKHYSASTLLMVRPQGFGFNEETASSNAFQQKSANHDLHFIAQQALLEFDQTVDVLRGHNIEVNVYDDIIFPHTPDAIFPNNWISMHENGSIILYPMQAKNRRLERRTDIIDSLQSMYHVEVIHDLSFHESDGRFLEGTGSIVFDHEHKIAYAALSERTDKDVFIECCKILEYQPIIFRAFHKNGMPVYHTNVLMHISQHVSAICLEMIHYEDRERILESLQITNHSPIILSEQQALSFAGNMLTIFDIEGKPYLFGSQTGFSSLTEHQLSMINIQCIRIDIPTIEFIGGGSARCMIAEILLPRHSLR
jgi:hypothetical protein